MFGECKTRRWVPQLSGVVAQLEASLEEAKANAEHQVVRDLYAEIETLRLRVTNGSFRRPLK